MNKKRDRLMKIISEIDDLIAKGVTSSDVSFATWENKAKSFILSLYSKDDYQYQEFDGIKFRQIDYSKINGWGSSVNQAEVCRKGLLIAKGQLENILELIDDESQTPLSNFLVSSENSIINYQKVFIVHGHDGELKHAVARLVEKQGLEAIILSEQANKGKTIIEKFEENSDVSGAICLFTADDLGRAKAVPDEQPRARQNVVFETGYFMGKLSRSRVVIIAESGVELPSDMQGIVYTNKNNWEVDVLKELKAMGYAVDFNKLF